MASFFRNPEFTNVFGVKQSKGVLRDLAVRAVIVLNEESTVIYSELVPEITEEPNYDAVISALEK